MHEEMLKAIAEAVGGVIEAHPLDSAVIYLPGNGGIMHLFPAECQCPCWEAAWLASPSAEWEYTPPFGVYDKANGIEWVKRMLNKVDESGEASNEL